MSPNLQFSHPMEVVPLNNHNNLLEVKMEFDLHHS
jgi:hypothetical protein